MNRMLTRFGRIAAAAVAVALLSSGVAWARSDSGHGGVTNVAAAAHRERSNAVRDWNKHALDALVNPAAAPIPGAGQSPPVSQLHLAMVQGAVYDAVNSIDGRRQPYLAGVAPASPSASLDAAVATAAHHVLVGLGGGLVPPLPQVVLDRLEDLYADALSPIPDGPAKTDGINAGAAAAAAMLAARANDGRYVPFSFIVGDDPGEWRPTPPALVNDPYAWVSGVEPFVLQSRSQFRTQGPSDLTSRAYAEEYNEVKTLGGPTEAPSATPSRRRSPSSTRFIPASCTTAPSAPSPRREGLAWSRRRGSSPWSNLAGADALINCWDDKDEFSFWRPITAIHRATTTATTRTVGDGAGSH